MTLLLTIGPEVQPSTRRSPILSVEIVRSDYSSLIPFQTLYETDDESEVNKLLNDYSNVFCRRSGSDYSFDFNEGSPKESPDARKIDLTTWKPRTRPALMRAATTTNFFNL